jgi:riboflavin kinase/FMN adenylyltransferase
MQVIEGLDQIPAPPNGVVLTIGNFDGVHRGHQKLFSLVVEAARGRGGTAVLLTFKPHPSKILHPGRHLPLLSTRDQRYRLFAAAGIEIAVVEPFTAEFSRTGAEEFIERLVLPRLEPRTILIGSPFRFGHDRRGDVALLRALGAKHGFAADGVEVVDEDGATISSSRIRKALLGGDVAAGARMLGRPFEIEGRVVHGDGRGRSLAFPTANLEVENELIPADGVYVTRLRVGGGLHDAVTNIGLRPTFDRTGRAIEAHLLGFQGDLYDQPVGLLFYERLREERRFPSPEALVDQIKKDVARARAVLAATPPGT